MPPPIRPLAPEELPLAEELYCNSFKISRETARRWTELTDPGTTRAVVDQGRVQSILSILPFEVWMFGRAMSMGGIAGVATWADLQGRGLAGRLVHQAIIDMHAMGYGISVLYPFSYRFYGRFGYTLACDHVTYKAAPADFTSTNVDDGFQVRLARFPQDMTAIQEVYDTAAPIWNGMLKRDEKRWQRWQDTWTGDQRHVYIIESIDDHSPEGYFVVEDVPLPEGGFIARVPEVLLGSDLQFNVLARFFARAAANVKNVQITLPRSAALWQLFREPRVETIVQPSFQARIIDVKKACRERGYESDVTADITFAIDDPHAPWNAGPWRILVSDGRALVAEAPEAEDPLILTIQEFTSIFVGYQKASELVVDQGVHLDKLEAMDDVFYDAETRLLDFF